MYCMSAEAFHLSHSYKTILFSRLVTTNPGTKGETLGSVPQRKVQRQDSLAGRHALRLRPQLHGKGQLSPQQFLPPHAGRVGKHWPPAHHHAVARRLLVSAANR